MIAWEYKVTSVKCGGANNANLDDLNSSDLDTLGQDGWELVDVESLTSKGGKSFQAYFIFKRPRS